MMKLIRRLLCAAGLVLLFAAAPVYAGAEEETEEEFSLYIESDYGALYGIRRGNDCVIFVPSGMETRGLKLFYTGNVAGSSTGKLNRSEHYLTGGFENGTEAELSMEDGSVIRVTILQSSVPAVFITLKNAALSDVHDDKDREFTETTVSVYDPEDPLHNFTDTDTVLHGRGNSSWRCFDKKGYLLKLGKKQNVLGMGSGKKWCLLANANDGTLMKNRIACELAKACGFEGAADAAYADLWINGEYRGLYLMTEKVEIAKNRLDLDTREAVLAEQDNMFYADSDIWFVSDVTGMHYSIGDTAGSNGVRCAEIFKEAVEEFELLLHTTGTSWDELSETVDMDSFVRYYVFNEMLLNKELLTTSFYMYMDGAEDRIHAGPVWDFDTSMNNSGDPPDLNFLQFRGSTYWPQTDLFARLCTYPEFVQQANELYENRYRDLMRRIPEYMDVLYEEIRDSAEMNFALYNEILGTETIKGDIIGPSFDENVNEMKAWFRTRAEALVPAHLSDWPAGQTGIPGIGIVDTAERLMHYAPVFDAAFYYNRFADIRAEYGTDPGALLEHYLTEGLKEGRIAAEGFDIEVYAAEHPELREEYGTDWLQYVEHYLEEYRREE